MKQPELLHALQIEIRQHSFDTSVDEPRAWPRAVRASSFRMPACHKHTAVAKQPWPPDHTGALPFGGSSPPN